MRVFILIIFMAFFNKMLSQDMPGKKDISYRSPTVAGTFYPNDPDTLRKWIDEYLKKAKTIQKDIEIYGLVAPHAGYVFSGWIAAIAYKQIKGKKYDDVIIISPSHSQAFEGACVFDGDAYLTPLGEAMVDKELAYDITIHNKLVYYGREGHHWDSVSNEHALEVQIPFIQTTLPDAKIIPIIMGSQDNVTVDALIKSVVNSIKKSNKRVLIVASSDLSHFYDAYTAERKDQPILRAFYRYDYFKMAMNFFSNNWEACGGGPIVVAMMIAEQLGANKSEPLVYSNSAQSPYAKGDVNKVVGYFSGVLYNDGEQTGLLPELSEEQRQKLLSVARKKIEDIAFNRDTLYQLDVVPEEFSEEYAVFVTIRKNGSLRGCMGHTIATKTLYMAVEEAAKLASTKDPRFPKIKTDELDEIEIDITILSRMKRILDFNEIYLGKDGVLLRYRNHSALFLPQVATEQLWDIPTMLEHLCIKAGLNKNDYKLRDVELYIFRGEIID